MTNTKDGNLRWIQGARQVDAVERIHLDVQKQQLRFLLTNRRERRAAVAEFAYHAQIAFGFAVFAQGTPAGGLIVDDDDIHHVPSSVEVCNLLPAGASRTMGGDSRIAGMEISLIHSLPCAPDMSAARPSNCTAMRSRTFLRPMPSAPAARSCAMVFVTRSKMVSLTSRAVTLTITGP